MHTQEAPSGGEPPYFPSHQAVTKPQDRELENGGTITGAAYTQVSYSLYNHLPVSFIVIT
jgi:hypothetical protein